MPKSIWDTRFSSPKAVTFDEALKMSGWGQDADEDGDDWITINGAHVLVGANGEVKSGAGGKFTGTDYKEAREWAQTRKSVIEAQKEWKAGQSVINAARTKAYHDAIPNTYTKTDISREEMDHPDKIKDDWLVSWYGATLEKVRDQLQKEGGHNAALKEVKDRIKAMRDEETRRKEEKEARRERRRAEKEARETRKRERAERREKKEVEARQKAEAKANRESEARQRAEKETREKAEAEARARREAESRQREEREAKEKTEREARQRRESTQREGSNQRYKGVVDLSGFGVTDVKEFEKEAEELAKEDKEFAKVKREVDEKLSKLGSGRRVRFVDRSEVPEGAKIGNYSDRVDVEKMGNRILENSKKADLRNFDDFLKFMADELSNPIPKR